MVALLTSAMWGSGIYSGQQDDRRHSDDQPEHG